MEQYFCFQDARFGGESLGGGGICNKISGIAKKQILLILPNIYSTVPQCKVSLKFKAVSIGQNRLRFSIGCRI